MLKRRLDEVLKKNSKSRYWLAKRIGMSERNLGRLAKGETASIDFEILEKICRELSCQPGDLFEFTENSTQTQ